MKISKPLNKLVTNAFTIYEEPVKITDSVSHNVKQLVDTVVAYKASKYRDAKDGEVVPFFQLLTFVEDVENRAVSLKEKNIDAYADDGDYVYSMIFEKELREEMDELHFGTFLKEFQESKTTYGTALLLVSECDNKVGYKLEVPDFATATVDPYDIEDGVKLFPHYLNFVQLEEKRGVWDDESIDELINKAEKAGDTRVDVYHIEGIMRECDILEDSTDKEYAWYEVYVGEIGGVRYYLFHTKLEEKRVYAFNREDRPKNKAGQGIGALEEVLEEQMWVNDIVISMHDAVTLGSKIFGKTNKQGVPPTYAQKSGTILEMDSSKNEDFTFVTPTMPNVNWFGLIDGWIENLRRKSSVHEAVTGEQQKAGTPYAGQALQSSQASSIFNYRREKDGADVRWILQNIVQPRMISRISREHTLNASYSQAQRALIDEYVVNEELIDFVIEREGLVFPEELEAERAKIQAKLNKRGDRRGVYVPKGFFTKEKVDAKIRYHITNDMDDVQTKINNLVAQMTGLAPEDPARIVYARQIAELSGQSPAEFMPQGIVGNIPQQRQVGTAANIKQVIPEAQA